MSLSEKFKRFDASAQSTDHLFEAAKARKENREALNFSFVVATKVNLYLRANGIKKKDLAELMRITPQQLGVILKGNREMTLNTIFSLQRATDLRLLQSPEDAAAGHIDTNKSRISSGSTSRRTSTVYEKTILITSNFTGNSTQNISARTFRKATLRNVIRCA